MLVLPPLHYSGRQSGTVSQHVKNKSEIKFLETYVKSIAFEIPVPTNELDNLFRETLEEVWN